MAFPATRLRLRRVQLGLTQFQVAQRADMKSLGRLSLLERGMVQARPDEIVRLATALKTTPADLFPEQLT